MKILESDSKLSALVSCPCDAAGEELDRGDEQPCGCRCDGLLKVLGKAAVAAEPCKGPLNDPSSGQDLEALGVVRSLDDLDRPFPDLAQRLAKLVAGIATICKDVPQPRVTADDLGQDERCTITVLDIGGMDHGMNEIAIGVGHDVPLAALDLLACIVAPGPAALGGFDALAGDHPGAGRGLASHRFPPDQQQGVIEREPQTIVAPQVEPASHRRDRRKTGRQHPPRQPAAQQIQDRLDNPPQWPFTRSSHTAGHRKERLEQPPFGVGQIAWQSQVGPGILRPGGVSPHR